MKTITQNELKKLLHYNPETGIFTRIKKTTNRVKIGDIVGSNLSGYLSVMIKGKAYLLHRLAFLYIEDNMPIYPQYEVDHINRIKDDNRWCNLRIVDKITNLRNCSMMKNNTSGFNGVNFDKCRDKWQSLIMVDGKIKYLGRFNKIEDAIAARKSANIKYGYHENHGK